MNQRRIEEALYIAKLIKRQMDGSISAEDQHVLDQWVESSEHNKQLFKNITNPETLQEGLLELEKYDTERSAEGLFDEAGLVFPPPSQKDSSSGRQTKIYKWMAAACLIAIFAGMAYFILEGRKQATMAHTGSQAHAAIVPGSSKAVLTLADGSSVVLDSSMNTNLTRQGKNDILKVQSGQLVYKSLSVAKQLTYNKISVPRGGEFRLVLSDGTKVWLNSASSIRYPVAFTGKERRVELDGEAYFEVTHKASMPFKVVVNGAEIQVLGTHFNINAYKEEPGLKATLLEGSIKLLTSTGRSVIIKPGQQAEVDDGNQIKINDHVDIQQVVAWQKGLFEFDNTPLTVIMGQISRWYNVDVVYDGQPGKETFGGGINKKQPLSTVLKLLEANGVQFKLEGRTLIVNPGNKK